MHHNLEKPLFAAFLALALHALVLSVALQVPFPRKPVVQKPDEEPVVVIDMVQPPPALQTPPPPDAIGPVPPPPAPDAPALEVPAEPAPVEAAQPRFMEAPPAPTAEEWAFAARYPLKNSKGYRHTWGQQVRSQMGTAIEGVQQGTVRFRVEIAPDGTLSRLETLWATSDAVEQRARRAIEAMPSLPATPTGKPLVFEKTINFSPFIPEIPPVYRDDCLPDPPTFRNRFAWDGRGQPGLQDEPSADEPPAMSMEDCLKLLPQDSIEAEAAHDQRQLDRWGSVKLDR